MDEIEDPNNLKDMDDEELLYHVNYMLALLQWGLIETFEFIYAIKLDRMRNDK